MSNKFPRGKRLTFVDRIHSFPPILCRLLARHKNGAPMSAQEISMKAGTITGIYGESYSIAPYRVDVLSGLTNWNNVCVSDIILFTRGCGVPFCDGDCKRVDEYLRTNA